MQRYLTAKSIDEARHSLLMSAFVKIPLQLLILGTGVLVFVFYVFQTPPMLFNRVHDAQVAAGRARRVRRAAARSSIARSVDGERGAGRNTATAFLAATPGCKTSARRPSTSSRRRRATSATPT